MNGEESELANQVSDPGMIASATGMRARDPWEMEQRAKRPTLTYADLRRGAFFRCVQAPIQLLQKMEHCAVTMDFKVVLLRDHVEVQEERMHDSEP